VSSALANLQNSLKHTVSKNIDSGVVRNVHIHSNNQAKLNKMLFSFNATKKTQRLAKNNFLSDIFDTTISNCVNVGMITTDFKPLSPSAKTTTRSRMFFLPNLNFNRDILCN
jgi:hypothetical protein